jgi:hypothetical protein
MYKREKLLPLQWTDTSREGHRKELSLSLGKMQAGEEEAIPGGQLGQSQSKEECQERGTLVPSEDRGKTGGGVN